VGKTKRRKKKDETSGSGGNSAGGISGGFKSKGLNVEEAEGRKKSVLREYAEAIIIAIILALLIRTFIVQAFKIPSGSMIPTLLVGDHILVWKIIYGIKIPFTDQYLIEFGDPKKGDIIVFKFPKDEEKDFIKRVIGEPGDTIEVRDKEVFLNGKPLEEPYAIHQESHILPREFQPRDNYGPIEVPPSSYFVMGDNRDHSLDSRFWGFVDHNKIKGRAFIIYFSWNGEDSWIRWDRLFSLVS
jgi:signal peptidase I